MAAEAEPGDSNAMAERQIFPLASGAGFAAVIHGNIVRLTAGTGTFTADVYAFTADGNPQYRSFDTAAEATAWCVATAAAHQGKPNQYSHVEHWEVRNGYSIANRSRAAGEDIDRALEEGFRQGVAQAMADGIITRDEEERLRAFRDRLALENSAADQSALAELDRAGADRVMLEARLAAISVRDGDGHLQDLALSIRQAGLGQGEANRLLILAWEAAVQGALEDGLLSLDEENALARYADYFSLTQQDVDRNGVLTSLVQAAVIRDVTQGIIPKRQRVNGAVPFNLMKSEQLVWVIQGVDYLETVVQREHRGASHGLSIRVARGLYYRPSAFRSRPIEWEETVHADTGMLGPHDQAHLLRREPEAVPGKV